MSASTVNVVNSTGQKIDTLWTPAGLKRIKVGLGTIDIAGDAEDGAWQAIATHLDGATFVASDGVALVAGTQEGGTTIRRLLVDSTGRLLTVLVPTQGSLTDRSGTITTGGTRQQVCAANASRKYFLFNNVSDTLMYINFGVNAVAGQPSIAVPAGASFTFPANFMSTQSVDVMCATTGKQFTAKEA